MDKFIDRSLLTSPEERNTKHRQTVLANRPQEGHPPPQCFLVERSVYGCWILKRLYFKDIYVRLRSAQGLLKIGLCSAQGLVNA